MKKIFLIFVVVLLLSANSFAGDYANLNFIGFSRDGRFLAFEEYGTLDGAGFPYSNIYFVNVEKNSFAAASVAVRIENEAMTETAARNKSKLAAAKRLRELKIIGGNTGTHAVSHLLTDFTARGNSEDATETVRFAEIVNSMYRKGDYELSLKPIITKTKDCEVYEQDIFKFELTFKSNVSKTTSTLQKDADLPKARGCATDYRIQEVYLYKNYIAVFINVFTPGFEGPDGRFMVVSGEMLDGVEDLPVVR